MNFADYLQKLQDNPRVDKMGLYNMDYTDLLFRLHMVSVVYAERSGLAPKDFPIPKDMQFKRTKAKVAIRIGFDGSLDTVTLNNTIIDLKMEKITSLLDGEGDNTLIEMTRYFSQDTPVEMTVPELG